MRHEFTNEMYSNLLRDTVLYRLDVTRSVLSNKTFLCISIRNEAVNDSRDFRVEAANSYKSRPISRMIMTDVVIENGGDFNWCAFNRDAGRYTRDEVQMQVCMYGLFLAEYIKTDGLDKNESYPTEVVICRRE